MYPLIRQGLFALDAEKAHELSLKALKFYGKLPLAPKIPENPVTVMGIQFKNPIGLAAGADKNGEAIDGFGQLGFGFIEVGTVTPLAQDGNPHPRQFRLKQAEGIINRNGFNNLGIDVLVENVRQAQYQGRLGINIGKNATTAIENSWQDYQICLQKAYQYADYIAINISSPNTQGLRSLQYGEALDHLLKSLKHEQFLLSQKYHRYKPLVLKIAPDLTSHEIVSIADSLIRHNIDGVIAGNTTLARDMVAGMKNAEQQGGLSGKPLHPLSTRLIQQLAHELKGKIPIIGCGGVHSLASGQEKIDAGASLVQLYSGLIYRGPKLVQQLATGLRIK